MSSADSWLSETGKACRVFQALTLHTERLWAAFERNRGGSAQRGRKFNHLAFWSAEKSICSDRKAKDGNQLFFLLK